VSLQVARELSASLETETAMLDNYEAIAAASRPPSVMIGQPLEESLGCPIASTRDLAHGPRPP
jgi:hypothetical protein